MSRNILLTIAIILAAGMNGILAYDISSRCGKEIVVATNPSPPTTIEPVVKSPEVEPQIDVLIVPTTPEICYPIRTRWEYRPFQPVRNLIRLFHNRRPFRCWNR
jgi:hypothetical protein